MSQHFDVFISYRRSDGTNLAQKLYDYLTAKGLRVFLDKEKMIGGKYFDEQIRQRVIDTPNYIFVGTPDAFAFRTRETDFVAEEIRLAISELNKAPDERVVLPVLTAGTNFPDKAAFPKGTEDLPRCDAVLLSGSEPTDAEYSEILKWVTAINKHNLWNAGHRWLENSKKPGGRFASLDIDATIMPKAGKRGKGDGFHEMPIHVFQKQRDDEGHESRTGEQPLLNALHDTRGHLYLIGEGGIGKTTALISVMNDAYDGKTYSEDKPVPLFVELSLAPDTYGKLYEGGISTFIRRAIYRQVREDKTVKQVPQSGVGKLDEVFRQDPDSVVSPVDELLTKKTPAPEYLLLLDGLNETSRVEIERANDRAVFSMIISEIQWILDNCPNVRVILTSRTDETAMSSEKITRLYLTGVDDDTIRAYLENRKLPKKRIDAAFADKNLIDTIRIPLFLTMYASLKNADEVSTQGEIFRMFFSERRSNVETYTAQGRVTEAEAGITSQASGRRITADMQCFILDFILPEIAWTMERKGAFYLHSERIEQIIQPVLEDEKVDSVCGKYGKKLFAKYKEGEKIHTRSLAKKLLKKLGDDMTEVTENILDCVVHSLGVMQSGADGYGFMHHHIRDYFAAVRNINSLRLAVYAYEQKMPDDARMCLSAYIESPINYEVRRLMGEYLHEQRNAPVLVGSEWKYNVPDKPEDRNLIKRALAIFRGRFGTEVGYIIFNLIEIIKLVRLDLSGEDLHSIDLSKCSLNGITLGRKNCGSVFRNSLLNNANLFPVGHKGKISGMQFSYDGHWLMTLSEDNVLKIWDTKTFVLYHAIENTWKAVFANTHNIIVTTDGKKVTIWTIDEKELTLVGTLSEKHRDFITDVSFSYDDSKILVSSVDKSITIWNVSDLSHVNTLVGHTSPVSGAKYSMGDQYIISLTMDREQIVWNTKSNEPEQILSDISIIKDSKIVCGCNGFYYLSAPNAISFYNFDTNVSNLVIDVTSNINDIAFCSDVNILAIACSNKTTIIWDIVKQSKKVLKGHLREVTSVAIGGEYHQWIATGSSDHTICIWNINTLSKERTIGNNTDMMIDAAYSPDAKFIVTASIDNSLGLWLRCFSLAKIIRLPAHSSHVNQVCISPDCNLIASASDDCTIKLWDINSYKLIMTLTGHTYGITSVAFSPDLRTIASSSMDKTIRVWDLKTHKQISTLLFHFDTVSSVIYSPDARWIFGASYDGRISIWNTETYSLVSSISISDTWINSIILSPDASKLLVASGDNTIRVYDVSNIFSIILLCSIHAHRLSVNKIMYSPDMRFIVSASSDKTVCFFDSQTFALVSRYEYKDAVVSVDLFPDMTCFLAVLSDGGVIEHNIIYNNEQELNPDYFSYGYPKKIVTSFEYDYVFDESGIVYVKNSNLDRVAEGISNKQQYRKLIGHSDKVMSIYYSGGNFFLTASKDHTAILWNAKTFSPIGSFIGHTNTVQAAILSKNERYAITKSADGTTKIWDVSSFKCINTITYVEGIVVEDCDFSNLHELSNLSDEDKRILNVYGAIV